MEADSDLRGTAANAMRLLTRFPSSDCNLAIASPAGAINAISGFNHPSGFEPLSPASSPVPTLDEVVVSVNAAVSALLTHNSSC